MPIKAIVTDINEVAEAFRPLYEQVDGKYKLAVEPAEGFELDNVTGLKTALTAERGIAAGLNAKLKAFEGIDPNAVKNATQRLAEFGDIDPAKAREGLAALDKFSKFNPETEAEKIAETKLANAKAQLKADFLNEKATLEAKLTDLTDKLAKRDATITKNLKQNSIAAELAKLNPLDEARDALELIAGNVVKLQEVNGEFVPVVVDAEGNPRVKLAADYSSVPFTVSDLCAELREKRPALFQPDAKRGLGTEQSRSQSSASSFDGPNPFAKATHNLTQQMILMRKDPNLAARLKAEAGA